MDINEIMVRIIREGHIFARIMLIREMSTIMHATIWMIDDEVCICLLSANLPLDDGPVYYNRQSDRDDSYSSGHYSHYGRSRGSEPPPYDDGVGPRRGYHPSDRITPPEYRGPVSDMPPSRRDDAPPGRRDDVYMPRSGPLERSPSDMRSGYDRHSHHGSDGDISYESAHADYQRRFDDEPTRPMGARVESFREGMTTVPPRYPHQTTIVTPMLDPTPKYARNPERDKVQPVNMSGLKLSDSWQPSAKSGMGVPRDLNTSPNSAPSVQLNSQPMREPNNQVNVQPVRETFKEPKDILGSNLGSRNTIMATVNYITGMDPLVTDAKCDRSSKSPIGVKPDELTTTPVMPVPRGSLGSEMSLNSEIDGNDSSKEEDDDEGCCLVDGLNWVC